MQKFLRTLMLVALMAVPFASQAQADCTSPQQIPYGENFDGYTGVATGTSAPTGYPAITLPSCWEFLNMSSTTTTYPQAFLSSSTTYAYSGNCLFFKSSSTTPLYALMPSMATSANEAYELTFYYRNEGISTSNGTIIVGVMSDATDATTFVALDTLERTTTKTLVELILPAGTLTSGSRVVFCYVGSSNNYYAAIDQVSLHAAPTCFKVSDLAINEELTTANSLTLTWNDALNANASYLIYDMSDTSVVAFNVTGNSYTVTGLSSNTVYTFAIISDCGNGDITEFSTTASGRTACAETTALPYAENFSGYTGLPSSPYYGPAVTPACWDYYSNGTNTAETTGSSSYYGGVSIYGYTSSYASMVANDPYLCLPIQITAESVTSETYRNYEVQRGNTKIAILPAFDQPLTGLQISFDYKMSTAYSETGPATTLELGYVEGTDVTSFVTIASYPAVTTLQHVAELNLSSVGQVPSNARLAFRFSGVHNGTYTSSYTTVYAGIDNILVEELPSCFHVTGLTVTGVTSESITLSWNDSINGNALYNIFMDGQLVITNVDGNSYTIVSLDPNTEYTFSVVTNCGSELSEPESVIARTACTAFMVSADNPFSESFEGTTFPPDCWSMAHTAGSVSTLWERQTVAAQVHSGEASAKLPDMQVGNKTNLVLPLLNIPEANAYQVSFWINRVSSTKPNEGVKVWVNTTTPDTVGGTPLIHIRRGFAMGEITEDLAGWYQYSAVIPTSGNVYIIFEGISEYGNFTSIDDITIDEVPSCLAPTDLVFTYIGGNNNAATITWTSNASSFNLDLNGVVTYGFATSSPATITGLDPNTTYTVMVQADCGGGDTSEWSRDVSLRTPCAMITSLPWNDGMEEVPAGSYQMPYCWSRYNNVGGNYPYSYSSSSYVHEGSRALYWYMGTSSTYADTAVAILPQLDVTTYPMSGNQLRFFARMSTATASIDVIVGSMSDPEDINTFVASSTVTVSGNVHSRYEVDLTNAGLNDAYAAIMVLKPSSLATLYVDDVTLMEIPTCFPPVMNEVTWEPNEYYDDRFYATVSWESTGDNNSYEIRILEDDEEDTITNGFSTDKRFSVAVFNTIVVWVRSICGAGDTSEWSAPVTLYKGYCEPNPTSVDGQGITGVSFGGMTNDTTHPTSAPFYGNYRQMAGSVPVGTTASVDITYSTGASTVYSYGTIIWVDWNKDYVFDDEEIVYTGMSAQGSGGVPEVLHATFDIPATQALGNYRMRIAGADSYFDSYVNTGSGNHSPCFSSTYAVAEDYTLTVTEAPVCTAPANLAANYANGTIELSWSSEATAFNLSVNGTVTNVTDTTATITDLEPNTTYTVMVQSVCGPADTSDWSTAVSITTPCNAISLPFTENFDPTTATISCWSKVDCNSQTMVYGDVFRFYYTTNPPQYLISPEFNPINGTMNVSFDYWVGMSSYPESFALGYSTTTNNSTDFTWLTEQTNLTNTAALNYSEELPAGVKYVAIKYTANDQYALYIDNVVFAAAAPVPDSVTITFAVNDATMGSIEPMGTHTYVAGEVLTVTATPAEGYHLYAWSLTTEDTTIIDTEDIELSRADTIISEMDGAIITAIFEADPSTGCNAVALPFVETFEETSATVDCWNFVSMNSGNDLGTSNGMGFVTVDGNRVWRFSSYTTASDYNQYGFSPVWTVPADAASLNVKVRYATYGNGDKLYFGYISGNDTVWGNTAYSTTGQSDFQYYEAPLPATATQLAVHYYGNYQYYAWIDSVTVTASEAQPCFAINDLAVTDATFNSVTVEWTGDAASYDVEALMGDNVVYTNNVTTTTATINGLTAETAYTVRVRSNCGTDNVSAWTVVNAFTGYCVPNPTSVDGSGITSVSFGGMTNTTSHAGSSAAYVNNSTMAGSVPAGTIASVEIVYGHTYSYGTIIWVDWNNNMVFEGSEVVYAGQSNGNPNPHTMTATFDIPATQALGNYRMRILGADSYFDNYTGSLEDAANANPCDSYTWGVAEDYTLTVTEVPSCLAPADVAIEYIGGNNNAATITWTSNASSFNLELNGVVTYGFATSSPATITGLDANTEYTVKVQADCGNGDVSDWTLPVSMRTPCGMITELPWSDGMEAVPEGNYEMPFCWSRYNNLTSGYNYYPYSTNSTSYSHEGSRSLYWSFSTYGTYPDTAVAILPQLDVTTYPMNGNQLSFYARMSSSTASINVIVGSMSDPEDINTFVASDSVTVSGNVHNRYDVNLTSAGLNDAYAAIMVLKPSSSAYLYVDDVTLHVAPSCAYVTGVVVDSVTVESVTISWQDLANQGASYSVYNGDELVASNINATTYTVENLTANTNYTIGVIANCPAGDAEMITVTAHTACSAFDMPFTEDFSTLTAGIPSCWNNDEGTTTSDGYKWNYYATGYEGAGLRFNSYSNSNGNTNILATPNININNDARLRFMYKNPTGGDFSVFASIDGGTTFDTLATGLTGVSDWTQFELNLNNSYTGETAVFYFKGTSNWGNGDAYIYLDNVIIDEQPSCLAPTDVAMEYIGGNDYAATISWTSEASSFNLELNGVVTYGFATSSPATITGLDANTSYVVRVQAVCGEDVSDWSLPVSITTPCDAFDLPLTETFDETSSSIDCWGMYNIANGTGVTSNGVFRFCYNTNPPQYLISPEFNPSTEPITVSFDYWVQTSSYPESFALGYSTTTYNPADFTWLTEQTNLTNTTAERYSAELPAGVKYVSIKYTANDMYYLFIDSVVFEVAAPVVPDSVTMTFAVNDVTMGTINPMGTHTYAVGDSLVVTATANEGYHLNGWHVQIPMLSVDTVVDAAFPPYADIVSAVMNGAAFTAIFAANDTTVTADTLILVLDLNDATLGSITPAPGTYKVPLGDSITIVATPNEGNVFNGWLFIADGDTVATIPIDSMALSATPSNVNHTMQMIAMFATSSAAPDSVTFVINTADATMGTTMPAPGTYRYAIGDTAFVNAIPAEGYHNLYWVSSITAMGVTMSDTVALDSLSMVISQWFANATFTLTAYFEADSTPVTPVVPEATIAASEILYWVGEGNNEVVMAVNWADTALAWGYRFSEDSVSVATMMDDIAAADPRFSYDGYPYINNIFFTENSTTLAGDTNSYWGSKNNGIMDAGMYQYLHNGDFEKWANTAAGVVVDSIYYEGWGWDYIYNYPMTIHPVSVPCINTYDTIAVAACDSYVWLGDTLTQSGLYTHIYENVGGCDSVVVLDLTVNYSVSVAVSDSVEGSYEWHNNIYVESGVYTWTGSTVANCDSTVTLTLTISNPCTPVYADTAVAIACDSYEWNNQYYYQSGLYVHMIDNPSGCDTVVSLDLTINYSVVNEISMTAVDSLVWHDSIYTESGVYSWHGTTINSCDSLVVLYLTIVPDSVTITFNVNDATMGSINPSGVVTYAVGDLLTVTATANEGYYLAGWMLTLDTVSETLTENVPLTYSNTVIAEIDGLIITALFAADTTPVQPETVTVTFNVNDATMGSINPSGVVTYAVGDLLTVTATANEGYYLAGWMLTLDTVSETLTENVPLTYSNTVIAEIDGLIITALFAADTTPVQPETVTVTFNVNDASMGTITPSGTQTFQVGDVVTITATPNENYRLAAWQISVGGRTETISEDIELSYTATVESAWNGGVVTAIFELITGIEDVEGNNAEIYSVDNKIVVKGVENMNVYVYDVNGRCVNTQVNAAETVEFTMNASGVYLVKVGNAPAKRVAVVR